VTRDQAVLLAVGGLALVCLLLLIVVVGLRVGATRSRAEVEALRERLERLETQAGELPPGLAPAPPPDTPVSAGRPVEFVITDLGTHVPPEPTPPPPAPAFADIVAKETVVMAASLAHGLRRGLAPATRNRIRFEMKQEVRRSRKQRRADLKAAQRDLHARQRATLVDDTEAAS